MEIINDTPFEYAQIGGRLFYPDHSLTFIVKATFDLRPGKKPTVSQEQLLPTGDEFYEDDEDMAGSIKYESDFAYFKPAADLLLSGKCHSPSGNPVKGCEVCFRVGKHENSLMVMGERYWKMGLFGKTASDPEAFTQMPLKYENCFGGSLFKKNPVGKGMEKIPTAEGKTILPVPNICKPDEIITSPKSKPDPCGFGPISRTWPQRASKLGTYGGSYKRKRWPWFPKDFNWRHFNAAPPEMQVDGYLKGDEPLCFTNMHHEFSEYRSELPGVFVRCFTNVSSTVDKGAKHGFNEVPIKLDTLWVDLNAEKLVLVFRGSTPVSTDEFEELDHLYITTHDITAQKDATETVHEQFEKVLDRIENEDEPLDELQKAKEVQGEDIDVLAELEKSKKESLEALLKAGIDPAKIVKRTKKEEQEDILALKKMGIEFEEEILLDEDQVKLMLEKQESFAGLDMSKLNLSGFDMAGADLKQAVLSGAILKNTNLTDADLKGAVLYEADFTGAKIHKADLSGADLTNAILEKADFSGSILKDTLLENVNGANAVFVEVQGDDAIFTGAVLNDAVFTSSEMAGADFSEATLKNANFSKANLKEAFFENAKGENINMSEADLTSLRASNKTCFRNGVFEKIKGVESVWEECDLTHANFKSALLEGANFNSAILEDAEFSVSDLKFARFLRANLRNARFDKANLFQGILEKADLCGGLFHGTNLYGAEFLDAKIDQKTNFDKANLKMTKLANME